MLDVGNIYIYTYTNIIYIWCMCICAHVSFVYKYSIHSVHKLT